MPKGFNPCFSGSTYLTALVTLSLKYPALATKIEPMISSVSLVPLVTFPIKSSPPYIEKSALSQ